MINLAKTKLQTAILKQTFFYMTEQKKTYMSGKFLTYLFTKCAGCVIITRSVTAQFVGTTYISGSVPNIYVLKVRRTLTLMRTTLGLIINPNGIENSLAHLEVNN